MDWIAQARKETLGCQQGALFLSSAGSSLVPDCVHTAVTEYLDLERVVGGYEAQAQRVEEIDAVYDILASHLNCHATEVAIIENATRAWQAIFSSIPFEDGDVVLTTQSEYHSNMIPVLQEKKRSAISIETVPLNEEGDLCMERLSEMLTDRVKLISLTHIGSNNGVVHDVAEVARLAARSNAYVLVDACQSAGQLPLDVQALQCDFLVASARKFLRGPRGIGFLYARDKSHQGLEPLLLDGQGANWCASHDYEVRSDARKFEVWEKNYALIMGLGAAVTYADGLGMARIWDRIQDIASYTRNALAAIPGVQIHDGGRLRCGIVTFSIEGIDPAEGFSEFSKEGVYLGYTGVRSTRFDMEAKGLERVFRASVHYFNTTAEIDRFVAIVQRLAK